jgi:ribosomal protein S27E
MTGKNFIRFHAEIVNGRCPTCEEHTMLVGITPEVYRCVNCGADLQQHVNGVISYIPRLSGNALMSELNKYFDGEKS